MKDKRLERWVDVIPLSADTMTILRLICIGLSLDRFLDQERLWAVWLFALGWVFDLFDGLKAAAETKRRGYPTKHGKYLDPVVDILCFVMLVSVFVPNYPTWLIAWFAIGLGLRCLLFLVIVAGRLWWRWKDRLPSNILPHSIAGQYKSVFAALSFGLLLLVGERTTNLTWATCLLGCAAALEMLSLGELSRGVWRNLGTKNAPGGSDHPTRIN